ncbi:MAG: AbrB family transcriptional regulator [Candidatus Bathyarchaeia archaeon]
MRISEIVRIDNRGRVTLPSTLREAVGLSEGMFVMLVADIEDKNVKILPFADPEAKLVEFHITIRDIPGALAKAASALAEKKVDFLSTTSRTLKRGESAEWVVIADISKCNCQIEELTQVILKDGLAERIDVKKIKV